VSASHPELVWCDGLYPLMTFVWDCEMKAYRVYSYAAAILFECIKDDEGLFTIPVKIKYISQKQYPTKSMPDEAFIKDVIENFDIDFKRFAKLVTFLI
jgi:hypothetical protein